MTLRPTHTLANESQQESLTGIASSHIVKRQCPSTAMHHCFGGGRGAHGSEDFA